MREFISDVGVGFVVGFCFTGLVLMFNWMYTNYEQNRGDSNQED